MGYVIDKERLYIIINKKTRFCIPVEYFDFNGDDRLLIPCTDGEKIGFVNKEEHLIVPPKYVVWDGICKNEQSSIVVARSVSVTKERKNKPPLVNTFLLYGAINHLGEEIIPLEYISVRPSLSSYYIFTVQRQDGEFAVITTYGDTIVPFGKYDKIYGFDKGFSKVRIKDSKTGKCKFGIIEEQGDVVLPLEWDRMRSFYRKSFSEVRVSKEGGFGEITEKYIKFSSLAGSVN